MSKRHLLIRVDGGPEIGYGHFMRMLGLAQAWKRRGHTAEFVVHTLSSDLSKLIGQPFGQFSIDRTEGIGSEADVRNTIECFKTANADFLVLDGYQFNKQFQRSLFESSIPSLAIDDRARTEFYWTDLVINPNAHGEKLEYSHRPSTKIVAGLDYVILREQFLPYLAYRPSRPAHIIPDVPINVLVMLGGGNSGMLMSRVIDTLMEIDLPLSVVALVKNDTENLYHITQYPQVTPLFDVYDVAPLMSNADIAVSAGGMTVWELAHMGVPSICISRGPQEEMLISGAEEHGIAINAGKEDDLYLPALAVQVEELAANAIKRKKMSNLGQAHVDGLGAGRVVDIILENINVGE